MSLFSHQIQTRCPACDQGRPGSQLSGFDSNALFSNMYTFTDGTAVTIFHDLCASCGVVYQLNPLTEESMATYYNESASHFGSKTASPSRLQLVERQLDWIEAVSDFQDNHTTTILDIGCGHGHFLDGCKNRWESTTSFIETNLRLTSVLESKNHNQFESSTQYNLICCIQVLEHFVDPSNFLLDLLDNLSVTGLVFIEVPCHTFHDNTELGACFEHVTYFNSTGLMRLLDRTGYCPIAFEIAYDSYYCDGRSRTIRALCKRKLQKSAPISEYILDHFEASKSTIEDLVKKIEELTLNQFSVALYGIGEVARLLLLELDSEISITLIDSDPDKASISDRKISHSSVISKLAVDIVIVTCNLPLEVSETLLECGFRGQIYYWRDHDSTLDLDDVILNYRPGTL